MHQYSTMLGSSRSSNSIIIKQNNNRVENPFKDEERNILLHYLVLLGVSLGLTLVAIRYQVPCVPDNAYYEALQSSNNYYSHKGAENTHAHQKMHLLIPRNQEIDFAEREAEGIARPLVRNDEGKSGDDDDDDEGEFQEVPLDDFPMWLQDYYRKLQWPDSINFTQDGESFMLLTREVLSESLRLGCRNMVENQKAAGNFNYQYDFVKQKLDSVSDSAVRQAGALWGVAMCYQHDPSNVQFKAAVEKGIQFFMDHSVEGPNVDTLLVRYPSKSARGSATGANALFGLGMIEYLRTIDHYHNDVNSEFVGKVRATLGQTIQHLKYMQRPNNHFAETYYFASGNSSKKSSPNDDGATMLCLVKAAKYIDGHANLIPLIEETAPVVAKAYTVDAWVKDGHDSDQTKEFYQWSSMFLTEYYEAGWSNAELYGDFVLMLGHWILHTHNVLHWTKNMGYAFEGIISAYEIAQSRDHEEAMADFEAAIDQGLYQLSAWQVGGPLAHENEFLLSHPTTEKIAIGGIMDARNEASLRIETTQHQMHAVIMALASVYSK